MYWLWVVISQWNPWAGMRKRRSGASHSIFVLSLECSQIRRFYMHSSTAAMREWRTSRARHRPLWKYESRCGYNSTERRDKYLLLFRALAKTSQCSANVARKDFRETTNRCSRSRLLFCTAIRYQFSRLVVVRGCFNPIKRGLPGSQLVCCLLSLLKKKRLAHRLCGLTGQ